MSVLRIATVFTLASMLLAACSRDSEFANQPPPEEERETIWDIFSAQEDPNVTINVNRYIWDASLDVLDFLPIQSVDPFSGVISTDWGRIQGSSAPYRATVYISSPALDARSLNVAVFRLAGGRSVPVSDEVAEQIEDAILTRARQLYIGRQNR